MDDRSYIYGRVASQEGSEAGYQCRDILGDDRFIACDFGGGESRPDNFASMLTVAGSVRELNMFSDLAIVTAEV